MISPFLLPLKISHWITSAHSQPQATAQLIQFFNKCLHGKYMPRKRYRQAWVRGSPLQVHPTRSPPVLRFSDRALQRMLESSWPTARWLQPIQVWVWPQNERNMSLSSRFLRPEETMQVINEAVYSLTSPTLPSWILGGSFSSAPQQPASSFRKKDIPGMGRRGMECKSRPG